MFSFIIFVYNGWPARRPNWLLW